MAAETRRRSGELHLPVAAAVPVVSCAISNFQPKAKRDHFKAAIAEMNIDTLKLYEMIKLMDQEGDWGESQINEHEDCMFKLFVKDSQSAMEVNQA